MRCPVCRDDVSTHVYVLLNVFFALFRAADGAFIFLALQVWVYGAQGSEDCPICVEAGFGIKSRCNDCNDEYLFIPLRLFSSGGRHLDACAVENAAYVCLRVLDLRQEIPHRSSLSFFLAAAQIIATLLVMSTGRACLRLVISAVES